MLSDALSSAIELAEELAKKVFYNNIVSIEHLALALLKIDEEVKNFFSKKNCNVPELIKVIAEHIREEYPVVSIDNLNVARTLSFNRVLERSVFVAQYTNRETVYGLDVIDSMFPEKDSFMALLMTTSLDISREEVRHYCSNLHKVEQNSEESLNEMDEIESENEGLEDSEKQDLKTNVPEQLKHCLTCLNDLVVEEKIDPLIGRESEIERICQILGRRKKNNVLIVGKPGVGKTALGEGLVYCIVKQKVPDFLKNFSVYSLDVGAAFAGTQYRGDYEKKLKDIVRFISKKENSILFIDEIQLLYRSSSGNDESASSGAAILKGDLGKGNLHCVATTTYEDYNKLFAKDATFARRFSKLDIDEPSQEETFLILKSSANLYQKYHNVSYSDDVLKRIISLSVKHIHDRFLPDKAFDLLDEIGSVQKVKCSTNELELIKKGEEKDIHQVTDDEVLEVFAKITKMPIKLNSDDTIVYRDLCSNLKRVVFGQDQAIEQITDAVIMNKSGLDTPNHPIGSFLFAGPTGVGKTEIALQLSKHLAMDLIRLDMSEYSSEFTVSKLIGSPPGYVGHGEGGILTNQVKNSPHSVVLFDEIEKAHPDIYNILLQILDNGVVTDSTGIKVNFTDTIIVLTTNCGAAELDKNSIGFTINGNESFDYTKAINSTFRPEFRNRLDGIVWFNNLSTEIIAMVFHKLIDEMKKQLKEKNIEIDISKNAETQLIKVGYDRTMGARPMRRAIKDNISKVLSREILFGRLKNGGKVFVDFSNNEYTFTYFSVIPSTEDNLNSETNEKIISCQF